MRIRHLSCGSLCPMSRRFMQGEGGLLEPAELCCHCLVIETERGLVLVDTGLGSYDVRQPDRLARRMRALTRPSLRLEDTALAQLRRLGYDPSDVRHIVLTHLDFDHAGGLEDFPRARVHLLEDERAAGLARRARLGRARYRPRQWEHHPLWETYEPHGERWFGFDAVRQLEGLGPDLLLIPLVGHTPGHAGVAVDAEGGWLLHAGDAYFFHTEMDVRDPRCPPGLAAYQRLMESDARLRRTNQERLRELLRQRGEEVTVFSSHDPHELAALQQGVERRLRRPGHAEEVRPSL